MDADIGRSRRGVAPIRRRAGRWWKLGGCGISSCRSQRRGNVRVMLDALLELGDVAERERGHVRRYWRLVAGS